MPSQAESCLGIRDRDMPLVVSSSRGLLTTRKTWIVMLVGSYLLSIIWLSGSAICVPYVIAMAPLGLTSLFYPPVNPANARVALGPPELLLHAVFWSLFVIGLVGCKRLNRHLLRGIFLVVVILLVLTMYGCSAYYHWAGHTIN